jgi:hypothetical protein
VLEVQPIRFRGVRSSANQMLLVSRSRSIRFFGAGISTNQTLSLFRSCPFRFFEAGSSVNQMILIHSSHLVQFSGIDSSAESSCFFREIQPTNCFCSPTLMLSPFFTLKFHLIRFSKFWFRPFKTIEINIQNFHFIFR